MLIHAIPNHERLFAKLKGELAFLKVALASIQRAEPGEDVLTQMHRSVTVIRGSLRRSDCPDLEAFVTDLEELLELVSLTEIDLTLRITVLIADSIQALEDALKAYQRGNLILPVIQDVREAVVGTLLEHAVAVN